MLASRMVSALKPTQKAVPLKDVPSAMELITLGKSCFFFLIIISFCAGALLPNLEDHFSDNQFRLVLGNPLK